MFGLFGLIGYKPNHIYILRFFYKITFIRFVWYIPKPNHMLLINQTELVRSKPNRARQLKFRIVIFHWFNWVVESWPFIIGPQCISLMGIEEEMVEMLQIGLACGDLKPQDRHNSEDVL